MNPYNQVKYGTKGLYMCVLSVEIDPIGWVEKGSLQGNNRTALYYASGPAQSERDLSLVFRFTSCKIFDQERLGGQTPEWNWCINVRCRWDYQSKGPLGNGVEGPGREHFEGGKEWHEFTNRGKITIDLAIRRYLAGDQQMRGNNASRKAPTR